MNHHPSRIIFLVDSSPMFHRPRDDILRAFEYQVRGGWKKGVVDHNGVKIDRWIHTLDIPRPRFSLSLSLPRIQDAYPSPLPSPPSSTITRPKFTSDPTIIFHGFAEWLRSFRIHGISARSLVAANHDFRSEILKGIACFPLFFYSLVFVFEMRVWLKKMEERFL